MTTRSDTGGRRGATPVDEEERDRWTKSSDIGSDDDNEEERHRWRLRRRSVATPVETTSTRRSDTGEDDIDEEE